MPDPKTTLLSFPLDLGYDGVSDPESVQPFGDRPRVVASYNTRLTKVRGRVSKSPASSVLLGSLDRCGGIVPCGAVDSTVAFFHPGDGGNRRVAGSDVGLLGAVISPAAKQNYFFPAQVARAGVLGAGATSFQTPSVCYDASNGYTYYAGLSAASLPAGVLSAIVITVLDDDGALVISPTVAVSFTAAANLGRFVAITNHGAGVVRLWHKHPTTNALLCSAVTISGLTLSVGAPNTLFTPSSATMRSIALAKDELDDTIAYLVCFTAAGTSTRVLRVDPVARTVSSGVDIAVGGDANTFHGIAYAYDGSTRRLIMMASWAAGSCSLYELNPTTLATVWTAAGRMWNGGNVSCGFLRTSDIDVLVFASSASGNVTSSASPGGTQFEFRTPTTGALIAVTGLPWHRLVGQIAQLKVTDTQHYPLIPVQVAYASANRYSPTVPDFVSDPSIEIVVPQYETVTAVFYWALRGRFGTDFCIRYPGYSSDGFAFGGCNSFICSGTKAKLAYLAENLQEGVTLGGHVPRYVDMDYAPSQPSMTILGSGQAVVAGAMPVYWDGNEIVEFAPIRAPKIFGTTTGGAGSNLTGTFLFAAVVSWKDAAGHIHRSPPSNIITLAPAGTPVTLFVTKPVTYRNGRTQRELTVTIYASLASGLVLYAQNTYIETTASSTEYWSAYLTIFTPAQNALTPPLYSDGSAQMIKANFCPNAFGACAVVGERLWLLDAERPGRAYYSQPMTSEVLAGIFPSFSPTQYVDFPAAAGQLVAVANWRETPRFHSSTGVWTVDGEGPDAINNPPFYSQPRQLSTYPVTDRLSVMETPMGIMFRSANRFVLTGDREEVFEDVDVSTAAAGNIIGCAVFREQHEVAVFADSGGCFVWNYLKNAWTLWDSTTLNGGALSAVVQHPLTGKAIYFGVTADALMSLDPGTVSTTAQILIVTGWIVPGGPQDDTALQNAVIRARRAGSHGVTVQVATNYLVAPSTRVYSAADVLAATVESRYDLWPQPQSLPARAVMLTLQETGAAGEAFQPQHVTLELTRNGGKMLAPLRQAGRK